MKPSIPKGTRDFLPHEVVRRDYMFGVIRQVFTKFGYQPIETSAMENLATLSGKYGEEGEKLLFRILNNGDFLARADETALNNRDSSGLVPSIARRGLRYDLTVPFARFVVMHRNEIQLPFKRYQIQPVWRADRPQKGRYQEFYQCDVDVVGSTSVMYEAELIQIYDEVFDLLKLPVVIRINHRQILKAIAEVTGISDRFNEMTVAIDKWDKIGEEGVIQEMVSRQISSEQAGEIVQILNTAQDPASLSAILSSSKSGLSGLAEVRQILSLVSQSGLKNEVVFDAKLARGLGYYTGCIFEVEAPGLGAGSIGGGGRYDNLTGVFGMPDIPGVGVSFGAERIYDALEKGNLFPEDLKAVPTVLILPMDDAVFSDAFGLLVKIRNAGIAADMYPEAVKMQKQMKYANSLGVPYVLIFGENERNSGKLALKNMSTGDQNALSFDQLVETIGNN